MALDPTETRVKARLKLRPNPAVKGRHGPLVLDGETITLDSVESMGVRSAAGDFKVTDPR